MAKPAPALSFLTPRRIATLAAGLLILALAFWLFPVRLLTGPPQNFEDKAESARPYLLDTIPPVEVDLQRDTDGDGYADVWMSIDSAGRLSKIKVYKVKGKAAREIAMRAARLRTIPPPAGHNIEGGRIALEVPLVDNSHPK